MRVYLETSKKNAGQSGGENCKPQAEKGDIGRLSIVDTFLFGKDFSRDKIMNTISKESILNSKMTLLQMTTDLDMMERSITRRTGLWSLLKMVPALPTRQRASITDESLVLRSP